MAAVEMAGAGVAAPWLSLLLPASTDADPVVGLTIASPSPARLFGILEAGSNSRSDAPAPDGEAAGAANGSEDKG